MVKPVLTAPWLNLKLTKPVTFFIITFLSPRNFSTLKILRPPKCLNSRLFNPLNFLKPKKLKPKLFFYPRKIWRTKKNKYHVSVIPTFLTSKCFKPQFFLTQELSSNPENLMNWGNFSIWKAVSNLKFHGSAESEQIVRFIPNERRNHITTNITFCEGDHVNFLDEYLPGSQKFIKFNH